MSNKKPEKINNEHKPTCLCNNCMMQDARNSTIDQCQAFNKQALGSVEDVEEVVIDKAGYMYPREVESIAQAIHNYYKERFGI